MMMRRERDAEAELNLPPGFRFHPNDEELVVHYLCRKVSYQTLPVPIIAEIDLYKFNPWQLPDMALFGTKEWYFFTPRDRKYPNGSRPNRAAGSGYWKATGADKPIRPAGSAKHLGIKKALVFYSGKAPRGIKTDWIMHEYRLAESSSRPSNKKGSLRLDDWVLCRIYNKKNNWQSRNQKEETSFGETMDSVDDTGSDSITTPESDIENEPLTELNRQRMPQHNPSEPFNAVQQKPITELNRQCMPQHNSSEPFNAVQQKPIDTKEGFQIGEFVKGEENDWFMDLNLDDLQNSLVTFGEAPALDLSYQDFYFSGLSSPLLKPYSSDKPANLWSS